MTSQSTFAIDKVLEMITGKSQKCDTFGAALVPDLRRLSPNTNKNCSFVNI